MTDLPDRPLAPEIEAAIYNVEANRGSPMSDITDRLRKWIRLALLKDEMMLVDKLEAVIEIDDLREAVAEIEQLRAEVTRLDGQAVQLRINARLNARLDQYRQRTWDAENQIERLRAELVEAKQDSDRLEQAYRRHLWANHGCPVAAMYGDDGRMDCNACLVDFKGLPLEELEGRLVIARLKHFAARLGEGKTP